MEKRFLATLMTTALFPAILPAGASVVVQPVSYDMPNGNTGTWSYFDETYSGSGNRSLAGAALSGGHGQLTDGVTGVDYWATNLGSGNAYEWVGWGMYNSPTIIFNLGKVTELESFSVFTNNAQSGGVSIFDTCTLSFSNNGTNFTDPITYTTTAADRANTTARFIDITTPRTAQYVQANFKGLGSWIFISEANFTAVPEPTTLVFLGTTVLILARKRMFER